MQWAKRQYNMGRHDTQRRHDTAGVLAVRRRGFGAGLTLCLCGLPMCRLAGAAHAQTGSVTAAASTAPPANAPPSANAAPPSASGGLLMQMGRELNALVLQSRDAVVSIQGHRALSAQEAMFGGFNPAANNRFGASAPPFPPASDKPLYVAVIGSGFLVQGDLVVTTCEVAENIINPTVLLSDGRTTLRVLAKSLDKENNIAVFKIARTGSADTLQILRMGDSESVVPGLFAVTIGNQAGFANSSGLAFIAKVGRRARSGARFYSNLIQFQGAVGPGSSGSPLIGPDGNVIGMVIATPDVTPSGYRWGGEVNTGGNGRERGPHRPPEMEAGNKPGRNPGVKTHKTQAGGNAGAENPATAGQGDQRDANARDRTGFDPMSRFMGPGGGMFGGLSSMGFALPVNAFRDRLDALAQNMQPVPAPGWMGLHAENGPLPGAYIINLYDGSPADRGGLEVGDIITQVEGRAIHSGRDFFQSLLPSVEGQTLHLLIQRGGATRAVPIRLNAKPDAEALRRMSQRVAPGVG